MSDAPSGSAPASTGGAPAATPIQGQAPATPNLAQPNKEAVDPNTVAAQQAKEKQVEQAVKDMKRKYSMKVNNKVKEINLDLNDDKQVQNYIQRALAADEKFEEASTIRKQAEQLVNLLKKDPLKILTHPELGLDVKALAQQVLTQEIEDMKKTPEQRRIDELERALKAKEERERQLEEEKHNAEKAKLEEVAFQELDDQISTALTTSDLPKSPYVVKRIADAMIEAVNLGYTDITVEQILPFVEQQITSEFQRMFEEAPEATAEKLMEKVMGKKNLDRYRKGKVAKVKKAGQTASSVKDTGTKPVEEKKKTKETDPIKFKEFFKPW